MRSDEEQIRTAWRRLGGDEAEVAALLARHREPHRRYHGIAHIAWVLRTVEELLLAHPVADPDAVRAAALYHDAIYDPTANDNEARSAQLAVRVLSTAGWESARVDEVARLIHATAGHASDGAADPHADPAAAVLLDADLGVLGTDPGAYRAYVTGVRTEYAHVDDDAWRRGRAAVLQSFLARDQLYATSTMIERSERRARANLRAELAELADLAELAELADLGERDGPDDPLR